MRRVTSFFREVAGAFMDAFLGRGERMSGRALILVASAPLAIGVIGANLIGAAILYGLVSWVIPVPDIPHESTARAVNAIVLGAFVLAAVTIGIVLTLKDTRPVTRWLRAERPPTPEEQAMALLGPRRLFVRLIVSWSIGIVVFVALNAAYSLRLSLVVGIAGLFSGLGACAFSYLVTERATRQIARRALEDGPEEHPSAPGVTFRVILVWLLTTGAPVLGVALVGGGVALGILAQNKQDQLAYSAMIICSVTLIVGLLAMVIVAKSVADPVRSVRRGVERVRDGDLNVAVPLYDASDLGMLQAGFNQMVAGLRERDRMRVLFGQHVGEDVAEQALSHGAELGGEVRDVAALFVDIVGSTELAASRSPQYVVDLLNRFFGVVVEVVARHGGSVNKFEGDAALCVFGAPGELADAAGCALAAARQLAVRLREDVPELVAGIGVSGGPAVAGNVGSAERLEYTVIGDPVNEAARLTEAAKGVEGMVAASGSLVERAGAEEASRWRLGDSVLLRGRSAETVIAVPAA